MQFSNHKRKSKKAGMIWKLSYIKDVPTTYWPNLSERTANLTHESMTTFEYSDELHSLSNRAELDEPKYFTIWRYKCGFTKPIQDNFLLYTINTTAEVFQAATQAEITLPRIQLFLCRFSLMPHPQHQLEQRPSTFGTNLIVLGPLVSGSCKDAGHSRANSSKLKLYLLLPMRKMTGQS